MGVPLTASTVLLKTVKSSCPSASGMGPGGVGAALALTVTRWPGPAVTAGPVAPLTLTRPLMGVDPDHRSARGIVLHVIAKAGAADLGHGVIRSADAEAGPADQPF